MTEGFFVSVCVVFKCRKQKKRILFVKIGISESNVRKNVRKIL